MTPVQSTVWSSSSSTSSTRDTNVTPKANADAPTWFKEALDHFLEEPLGDAWLNCVGKYVELEKSIMYGVGETQVRIIWVFFLHLLTFMFSAIIDGWSPWRACILDEASL